MTANVTDLNAKGVTLSTGLAPAPLNERGGVSARFSLICAAYFCVYSFSCLAARLGKGI